ncbi:hypothetical protein NKG05_14250 [Oerskovia sp. M15]
MLTTLTTATTDVLAHGGAGWGPGPWWFVFPLLWFALFATVIFLFARRARRGGPGATPAAGRLAGRQRPGLDPRRAVRPRRDRRDRVPPAARGALAAAVDLRKR